MSHLRDLFHKTSGHEHVPSMAAVAAVPENVVTSADVAPAIPENIIASANVAPAVPAFPDFPVEEAQLRPESRLAYHDDPRSPAADRFRLLRMRLRTHWKEGRLKKLLITSPLSHDGKSTVVLNLAAALAERGKRTVLVVEADLHKSSLENFLGVRPSIGLTECLVDDGTPPLSAIRRIDPLGCYLLSAGEPRKNATELLQTPAFGNIMQRLAPCFDWILVDSPPVIPLTDALSLQQHSDASLLIVRAGRTPREAVDQTIALLGKKNIVGVVLNGVEAHDHLYYHYHSYR
jgi:capsular exopolysaccharide synthesis family protein